MFRRLVVGTWFSRSGSVATFSRFARTTTSGTRRFTKGNKLQLDKTRETMVLSFTFVELGQLGISDGSAWLTPVCLRSAVMDKVWVCDVWVARRNDLSLRLRRHPNPRQLLMSQCQVQGGWSHIFSIFLNRLLVGPRGLATGGVAVTVAGESLLIFAALHGVIADGEGHAKAWDWKGASSMKPCIKHFNVLRKEFDADACHA